MINNIQYYTNKQEYQGCRIPTRDPGVLRTNNHLAEFSSSNDKEQARSNLGIPDIIKELDNKIDNKVISENGVNWDIRPTYGNTNKVLSSHIIYQTLLNYISKEDLDQNTQILWNKLLGKICKNYDKIEIEINQVYEDLSRCINNLEQCFNDYNFINDQKTDRLQRNYENLLEHFAKLKEFIRDEYLNLYQSLFCNINKDLVIPLEEKINHLQLLVDTFLKSSGGTALTDQFGLDDYLGVSQKTLTIALNDIWEKIKSITGEMSSGISMSVSPSYFIGDSGCTINVSATSCQYGQTFDHIAFYSNNVLLQEASNVKDLTFSAHIDETSEIKCVAKILGVEYVASKTITQYNNFFIFAGNFDSFEQVLEYASNHLEFSVPVTEELRENRDITCQDNDKIIILMGKSLEDKFIRADLNGLEIPFEREVISLEGEEYIVLTSTNTYNAGTYNIDING